MSADEDTELRDLVAQTLENTGVLGKIRVSTEQFSSLVAKFSNLDILTLKFSHLSKL